MKKKRIVALALSAMLANGVVAYGAVDFTTFTDYTKDLGYGKLQGHWAESNIKTLYNKGGIAGYPEGDFRANKTITSAELIALILSASNNGNNLTGDNWADKIMNRAYELGIATPENISKAEANKPISREKMAYILINSANKINGENTKEIKLVDTGVIADLNKASTAYRDSIRTAYSMGLLAGKGNGYEPKASTTRAEATAIINRLFKYVNRVEVKYEAPEKGQAGVYTALPDGSNVGESGRIYPVEGMIAPDGSTITRDPVTGVLGYGNGQKGHIYDTVGAQHKVTGETIYLTEGSVITPGDAGAANVSGRYKDRGDYRYFASEWGKIDQNNVKKLNKENSNVPSGTVADIDGNIIKGGTAKDKNAMYEMTRDGEWAII